jgi:hypothetical protein
MVTAVNGQKIFAAGRFFGMPNVTTPTPTAFSIPQDQSITFKRSTKSLFGENQFAADISAATMEVTGKVTLGTLQPRIFSDLLFGDAGTAGQIKEANNEAGVVPAVTTYIITVANSATWTTDLGVRNADSGNRYTRVATTPVVGKSYTVAAGVYTFAAGDANANMKISYLYTVTLVGETIVIANQQMGNVGAFTAVMQFNWASEQSILTLNYCLTSDTEISTKQDDYAKPTFGFMASCDANDNLGSFSFAEAA